MENIYICRAYVVRKDDPSIGRYEELYGYGVFGSRDEAINESIEKIKEIKTRVSKDFFDKIFVEVSEITYKAFGPAQNELLIYMNGNEPVVANS